jgi:RNA polymerase sigma-70 factor, ECF subfamily
MYGRNVSPMSVLSRASAAFDEPSLVVALIARDPGAARLAWTRLSPLVMRVLRRYFGPGADRQDLCQEVFLRFFTRIAELRDHHAMRSFIIGICLGVAQNELRRAKVRRWISLTATGEPPDAPVSAWNPEAREAMARFYRLLERVSAEDRALFVTRYIEKMEVPEIAAALGMPLSTTKRRLTRAVRRIGAKMAREPALAEYVDGLLSGRTKKPDKNLDKNLETTSETTRDKTK